MIDDWIDNPNPDGAVCYDAINGRHVMWSGGCDRAFHVGCEGTFMLSAELYRGNSYARKPCAGCNQPMDLKWGPWPAVAPDPDSAFQNHYL